MTRFHFGVSGFGVWAACMAAFGVAAIGADDFDAAKLDQWHQWRGPAATGVAPHGNPPVRWSDTKNIRWKKKLTGQGSTTPIVWKDRVFVLSAINTEKPAAGADALPELAENPFGIKRPRTLFRFVVTCLDRKTGDVLWEQVAAEALPEEGHHDHNNYASSSPTTDGQFLYAWFGSRGVFCFDFNGKLIWKYGLEPVRTRNSFGEGCSPVLWKDFLVLNRDNEDKSQIIVLNAKDGTLRWQQKRAEVSAWATPIVVEYGGKTQVITNATALARSYDLSTGELIWQCGGQVTNVIPSPIRYGDNVICMSGYRGSVAMSISLGSHGDVTAANQVAWKYDKDTPYVPSAVLYDDFLYFNKSNSGILTCLDAKSGRPHFAATRMPDIASIYSSPVGAADRLYFVSRDGKTLVIKKGSQFEVLASNSLGEGVDASPAIVGSQLFLRGQQHLFCIEGAE